MCGIAGIVTWRTPITQATSADQTNSFWVQDHYRNYLHNMSRKLSHRGPDGEGCWLSTIQHTRLQAAGFVHRRLAIIDLPAGHQPMANEDDRVHVVFNGEIYNHVELRQQLQACGHIFRTDHSDTEVLVHGWEQWGEDLPKRLIGMFAFAIYDTRTPDKPTLFLARDRMGQKPLFYSMLDDSLVFSSTIPSLLAWEEIPQRMPTEQLGLYLLLGYLPPPQTIYRDVSQVAPGHFLRLTGEVLQGGRYFSAPMVETTPTQNPVVELRRVLTEAVQSQMIADVPITCFLSGGTDSSLIAALLQQTLRSLNGPNLRTVSVGFTEAIFDETQYAAQVARHIGSDHTRIEVNPHQNIPQLLENLMTTGLGQPYADSSIIPTFQLSQAVRALAPVALSGDGGDELFGGYDRYRALPLLQKWAWALRFGPTQTSKERWNRMALAARGTDLPDRYSRLTALFSPSWIQKALPEAFLDYAPGRMELRVPIQASPLRYAMARDQADYLPGDVLWKVDTASMAVALEVRSPMLDHRVVEFANSLPTNVHFGPDGKGKFLLKQLAAQLVPPEILNRPKQGFGVPIGEWFRTDPSLKTYLHDKLGASNSLIRSLLPWPDIQQLLTEHTTQKRDHTHRLFSLLMLELAHPRRG